MFLSPPSSFRGIHKLHSCLDYLSCINRFSQEIRVWGNEHWDIDWPDRLILNLESIGYQVYTSKLNKTKSCRSPFQATKFILEILPENTFNNAQAIADSTNVDVKYCQLRK